MLLKTWITISHSNGFLGQEVGNSLKLDSLCRKLELASVIWRWTPPGACMVARPPLLFAVAWDGWALLYCEVYVHWNETWVLALFFVGFWTFFYPSESLCFNLKIISKQNLGLVNQLLSNCQSCPAALQYFRLRHLGLKPECKKPFWMLQKFWRRLARNGLERVKK